MGGQIILEAARLQQLGLDDVIEAQLPDRDENGPAGGPVRAVEELLETFLPGDANEAVDRVLVTGMKNKCILGEETRRSFVRLFSSLLWEGLFSWA